MRRYGFRWPLRVALLPLAGAAFAGALAPMTWQQDHRVSPRLLVGAEAPAGAAGWASAEDFLKSHHADFDLPEDLSNLRLIARQESLLGTHHRFQQVLDGVDVEGGEIVVSMRPDGEVFQVFNTIYPVPAPPALSKVRLTADQALDAAWNHLRVHGALLALPAAEARYVPEKDGFRLVYRVRIGTEAPFGYWEHRVDAQSGEILSVRSAADARKPVPVPDFSAYAGAVRSRADETSRWLARAPVAPEVLVTATANGSGRVFDPDPRTTLANAALLDSSPSSSFTAAYFTRALPEITSNAGAWSLTGPWVHIADAETPTTAPSTTTNGAWTATRGNNAFNDAMTYFHLDQNQRYLQALGFTNVQHGSITADSDGVGGDDNSWYVSSDNHLAFGHGGVDDNEDADVILHEYGHAITYSIVPTWGAGGDTGAIGEGFGDYWGASYSYVQANGSTFNPAWAFSWDGHSADTWTGRFLDMTNLVYDHTHTYSDHETISGLANYSDQLWGTPIYQAFRSLLLSGYARTNVDRIMIQSFYGIGGSPKMRDLAYAIVNTASNLFPAGPYAAVFLDKFQQQAILPQPALASPAVLFPAGGEIFLTGDTIRVVWNRGGAPSLAAARIDFLGTLNVTTVFLDAVEGGTNGWTRSHASGTQDWATVTTTSHTPTHAWFGLNQPIASDLYLVSPAIGIASGDVLSFWHRYALEPGWDGGVVEISTNAGTTWTDIGASSSQNGYTSTLGSGSALASRQAFSGTSGGFVETRIPLSVTGSAKFRFRLASDTSVASNGWWVDDVIVQRGAAWANVAVAPTNAAAAWCALPGAPSTTATIRIQQFGAGYSNSAWVQSLPFTVSADSDGDGLPDAWEIRYFTNLVAASGASDLDGDGFTELGEYRAGTSPTNAASLLKLVGPPDASGLVTVLRWASSSNRTYTIARATNLLDGFVDLATGVEATPPENAVTNVLPFDAPAWYFQIRSP